MRIDINTTIIIDGVETDYVISTDGKVTNTKTGKILKDYDNHGYRKVTLSYKKDNETKTKTIRVHRLVAEHFIENPENKPEVNHKDLDKTNNKLENLEWVTKSENQQHMLKMGARKLKDGYNSKYNKSKIEEVCRLLMEGKSIREVADITGLSFSYITALRNGEKRKHVTKKYNFPNIEKQSHKFSEDFKMQILDLIKEGYRPKEISSILDVKYNRQLIDLVRYLKNKNNI